MTTYKDAGVDIEKGDFASKSAYQLAKSTFDSRTGLTGCPLISEDGYAGLIDMGDFYLAQNDDGVGTKSIVASQVGKFDTLGEDLLCMVTDDAICMGAEVISVTNTMDVHKVEPDTIKTLMEGLAAAAKKQKIALTGGEIAEVPGLAKGLIWNATAVSIVKKDRVIDGSKIKQGDSIVALPSQGFRSNGLTLTRKILDDKLGPSWYEKPFLDSSQTWGEAVLTPSIIYHADILNLIGRFDSPKDHSIHGIAHITGGGIAGNLKRIIPDGLGAEINLDEQKIPQVMRATQALGEVALEEALKTWNMGVAMLIITPNPEEVQIENSYIIGQINDSGSIQIN